MGNAWTWWKAPEESPIEEDLLRPVPFHIPHNLYYTPLTIYIPPTPCQECVKRIANLYTKEALREQEIRQTLAIVQAKYESLPDDLRHRSGREFELMLYKDRADNMRDSLRRLRIERVEIIHSCPYMMSNPIQAPFQNPSEQEPAEPSPCETCAEKLDELNIAKHNQSWFERWKLENIQESFTLPKNVYDRLDCSEEIEDILDIHFAITQQIASCEYKRREEEILKACLCMTCQDEDSENDSSHDIPIQRLLRKHRRKVIF